MSTTHPAQFGPLEKKRPIPKKVRQAYDAIVLGDEKTITAAAAKVGLSREYLSRSLGKPHVVEFLRTKAARTVALAAGRASARVTELIDAASEHVSFDASRHVLAVAGIKPAAEPNVNFNLEIRAGWAVDLSAPPGTMPEVKEVNGVVRTGANDE